MCDIYEKAKQTIVYLGNGSVEYIKAAGDEALKKFS